MEPVLQIVTLRNKHRNTIARLLVRYFALRDVFVRTPTKSVLKMLTVLKFAISPTVRCLCSVETDLDSVFQIEVSVKVVLALRKKLSLCKIPQTFIKDLIRLP